MKNCLNSREKQRLYTVLRLQNWGGAKRQSEGGTEGFSKIARKPALIITRNESSFDLPTIEEKELKEITKKELKKIVKNK